MNCRRVSNHVGNGSDPLGCYLRGAAQGIITTIRLTTFVGLISFTTFTTFATFKNSHDFHDFHDFRAETMFHGMEVSVKLCHTKKNGSFLSIKSYR